MLAEEDNKQAQNKGTKKSKKKTNPHNIDMSILDEKSIKTLAKLLLALIELNTNIYDFFEGAIYEQQVKTKTKQNNVEIIDAKDFFDLLQARGVRKKNNEIDNLKTFLQIDPNYHNLLMVKKLTKALDEMTKNEELMNQLLAADGDEDQEVEGELVRGYMGGGQINDEEGGIEQNIDDLDYNNMEEAKERLITIGEDKDEDKQFDTNKENSRGGLISQKMYQKMKEESLDQRLQGKSYDQEDEQNYEEEDYEQDDYEI